MIGDWTFQRPPEGQRPKAGKGVLSFTTILTMLGEFWRITGMSMELTNYLVSWVVTYLGDLQPTYIGVIIYLLSSMDILV